MAHLYNEETISQAINTKWAGKTVHFAKETDSTNSWIKRLAKELYYDDTAPTSGIFTAVCVYADTGYGNGSGTGSRETGF